MGFADKKSRGNNKLGAASVGVCTEKEKMHLICFPVNSSVLPSTHTGISQRSSGVIEDVRYMENAT